MSIVDAIVVLLAGGALILVGVVAFVVLRRTQDNSAGLDALETRWAQGRDKDQAAHAADAAEMNARLGELTDMQAQQEGQITTLVKAAMDECRRSLAGSLEQSLDRLQQSQEALASRTTERLKASVDDRLSSQQASVDETLQRWKAQTEQEVAEILTRHMTLVRTELKAYELAAPTNDE